MNCYDIWDLLQDKWRGRLPFFCGEQRNKIVRELILAEAKEYIHGVHYNTLSIYP